MKKTHALLFASLLLVGAGCAPKAVPPKPVACTLEAKQCPDGSYVGRTGPNCEFEACPTAPPPVPPKCPDVCAAVCSGQPEPDVPQGCPMPMCACDMPVK